MQVNAGSGPESVGPTLISTALRTYCRNKQTLSLHRREGLHYLLPAIYIALVAGFLYLSPESLHMEWTNEFVNYSIFFLPHLAIADHSGICVWEYLSKLLSFHTESLPSTSTGNKNCPAILVHSFSRRRHLKLILSSPLTTLSICLSPSKAEGYQ